MLQDHETTKVSNGTGDHSGAEQLSSAVETIGLGSSSEPSLASPDGEFMYFCSGLSDRERSSLCSHLYDSSNPYAPPSFSVCHHEEHTGLIQRLYNDCSNQEVKDNVGIYFVSTASASVIANELITQLLNIRSWDFSNSVVQKSFFMVGVVALCAISFVLSTCEWYRRKSAESPVSE